MREAGWIAEQKVAGERLRSGNPLPQFPEDSSRDFRSILISLRGYTLGCFAKCAQGFGNEWVAGTSFSGVWKVLRVAGCCESSRDSK